MNLLELFSLEPMTIFGIVSFIVLFLSISFLILRLRKKKATLNQNSKKTPLVELEKLKKLRNQNQIEKIDSFVKDFFKERFNLSKNMDYEELASFFRKRNDAKLEKICLFLLDLNYSGRKVDKKELDDTLNQLEEIIENDYLFNSKNHIMKRKNLSFKKLVDFISEVSFNVFYSFISLFFKLFKRNKNKEERNLIEENKSLSQTNSSSEIPVLYLKRKNKEEVENKIRGFDDLEHIKNRIKIKNKILH